MYLGDDVAVVSASLVFAASAVIGCKCSSLTQRYLNRLSFSSLTLHLFLLSIYLTTITTLPLNFGTFTSPFILAYEPLEIHKDSPDDKD